MPNAGDVIRASDLDVQSCRVTRLTGQSIPKATTTTINFDTERFDSNSMHSTTVNNSRITINVDGYYILGFGGEMEIGTLYTRIVTTLLLNGATPIGRQQVHPSTSNTPVLQVSTMMHLLAGDYVEVQIFQDQSSGTLAKLIQPIADRSPDFWAARIGG